jgi:hypothetical protein
MLVFLLFKTFPLAQNFLLYKKPCCISTFRSEEHTTDGWLHADTPQSCPPDSQSPPKSPTQPLFDPFRWPLFLRLRSHACLTYPAARPRPQPEGRANAAQPHSPRATTERTARRHGEGEKKLFPVTSERRLAVPGQVLASDPAPIIPRRVRAFDGRTNPVRPATGLGWVGLRGRGRGEAPNPNGTAAFSPPHLRCFRPF